MSDYGEIVSRARKAAKRAGLRRKRRTDDIQGAYRQVKIILDTNAVISGLCFGGYPGKILSAWHNQQLTLVLSASILADSERSGLLEGDVHRAMP